MSRMSKMNEMPPTFLPPEWILRGQRDYGHPEGNRLRAHRIIAESQKLVDQSDKATERIQEDVNKKLAQRIQDVRMWRRELFRKQEEMVEEIEALLGTRLERVIESCSEALSITLQCLADREKYVGSERDRVESELLKERELMERVITLLHSTLKQTNEQIRLNRSAKYFLERDLQDNIQAEQLDNFCCVLNKTPPKVVCAEGPDLTPPGATVSPEEWNDFTNMKVCKVEQERKNSVSLRTRAESMLEQMAADLRRQRQATEAAIKKNIQDNRKAKEQMEESLAKLLADTESMERNMSSLQEAIEAKQGLLNVAQVQLAVRSQRPGIEQCQDAAQIKLLAMVQELSTYIGRLSEGLCHVEVEFRTLNRSQVFLEEQIQIKLYALEVDEATYTQLFQQKANVFTFCKGPRQDVDICASK